MLYDLRLAQRLGGGGGLLLLLRRAQALEQIGNNLQAQYERWQSRARYRQLLDPTADELRRMCLSLRRSARGDRLLLHYNGHGVPRPTANSLPDGAVRSALT